MLTGSDLAGGEAQAVGYQASGLGAGSLGGVVSVALCNVISVMCNAHVSHAQELSADSREADRLLAMRSAVRCITYRCTMRKEQLLPLDALPLDHTPPPVLSLS